jgi:hypothetical protein
MPRASRSALLTAGAVLLVLGGLVAVGRWSQGQLDRDEPPPAPSRPPATTTVAPNGVVARVGGAGPVEDVAVGREAVWVSDPDNGTVVRIDPRRDRLAGDRVEADGEDLTVAADGVVWATSGTRLLGLGRGRVLGPRRDLHELSSVQITAVAAGPDGLWLGTPAGLFRVDRAALE